MKTSFILLIFAIIVSHILCGIILSDFEEDNCSAFENKKNIYCQMLDAGDDNKICSMINDECISTYRNCEDYKGDKIEKDICESIIPENYITNKCVFSENKCITEQRVCLDFKIGVESNTNCNLLKSNDDNKRCLFNNGKCEEQYKHCEDYKENNKDECESIMPYDDKMGETDKYNKCVLEGGKCITKKRLCEDSITIYGIDPFFCEGLQASDESKRCALVNYKCIEQYKQCKDYNGNNKEICESIEPYDEERESSDTLNKCVLEEGKCIQKEKNSCSDYKPGGSEVSCIEIHLQDPVKACVFSKNECIETYKICEDYNGNNKEICESIIPTYQKDDRNYIRYKLKCVYENQQCKTKTKSCSEYIFDNTIGAKMNIETCYDLEINDKNKICFLYNDGCIESYSKCEDYNQNVEKDICENIIPENYETNKCVYDSNKHICKTVKKTCSSYQTDLFKYICDSYGMWSKMKCGYSKGKCFVKDFKNYKSIYFD